MKAKVALLLFALTLFVLLFLILNNKIETNCWSQYTTEKAAIENCENHNEK
jgi:hypothetical protein